MKPLILDRPAQQALPARLFWALLTAAGWGVWIALWLPVLRAIPGMLGVGHRDLDLTAQSTHVLMTDLASHMNIAIALVSLFITWALAQWRRNHWADRVSEDRSVSSSNLAQSMRLRECDLRLWQRAQRMVVTHDDALGWISGVKVSAA